MTRQSAYIIIGLLLTLAAELIVVWQLGALHELVPTLLP
jgi:hypothetical protein